MLMWNFLTLSIPRETDEDKFLFQVNTQETPVTGEGFCRE